MTKRREESWESHRNFAVDASVCRDESAKPPPSKKSREMQSGESGNSVTFLRTRITVPWTELSGTLLELAEAQGIAVDYGCRYGDCATRLISLVSGEVEYLHATGATPDPGTCLPCSCWPVTPVVLGS